MKKICGLMSAALVFAISPVAFADEVIVNGGFETEGFGGLTDSANWTELAPGAPGTFSRRAEGPASSGIFSHHLSAVGANMIGSTAIIIQNGIADGGLTSLEENTTVRMTFKARVTLGPGGVAFYALRVLNSQGAIVANTGLGVITSGTNGSFDSFSTTTLTVPAFGPAPNDAFSAFVEISVAAGAFPESTAEAFIDDLVVTGTLVAGCTADFNADGFLDFFDYDDFVDCFETGNCPDGQTADFNGDAFVDFFDYDDFVNAFETGC